MRHLFSVRVFDEPVSLRLTESPPVAIHPRRTAGAYGDDRAPSELIQRRTRSVPVSNRRISRIRRADYPAVRRLLRERVNRRRINNLMHIVIRTLPEHTCNQSADAWTPSSAK